jgi:hypothetical protein
MAFLIYIGTIPDKSNEKGGDNESLGVEIEKLVIGEAIGR